MYTIPGYNIKAKIFESPNTLVYRGERESDALPVVLKILKDDYPAPEELVRYRQEYEITRNLEILGVIKAYGQQKYGNSLAIILEDFGGESLKILSSQSPFPLTETLKLAIRIGGILGELHQAGVIHKDINPSNIVYNPGSDVLKVIDFGISTKLSREMPELKNPERLEGTLAYMSPEQTGRMNRVVDYRTDFYALGATLYELCTGRLPFTSQDPLELAHAHLTREPDTPEGLPENLSQVVLKLLAKRAEDRYQTAAGLVHDLELCLAGPGLFAPGAKDVSARFQLPQKLYGREVELETLLNTAGRAAAGASEALFVAGYSGVGKSALIKELYGTLIRPGVGNGYFISGKFDQYHRSIPYSAAREAFRDLIRQLLTESEERLAGWRKKICQALGKNGRVLTDFLPELVLIIGEQAPVPDLDPGAARNRFTLELRKFVGVFLQPEHPLVLFLDDLQWADLASLDLIKLMTSNTRYLFFLGAYRDNEVGPGHSFLLTLDDMRKANTPLASIALPTLGLEDVRRYIADATFREPGETEELAQLAKQKTDGNPFFLGEFLKSLEREALLVFEGGSWSWEMQAVQEQNISDNVVELMAGRVRGLPADTRAALTASACLGNTFDLSTLALIHGKSIAETAGDLWPALELNMLLPLRDEYKIAALEPLGLAVHEDEIRFMYKFAHDRIEEAGYHLIPEEERNALHLKVGRLLWEQSSEDIFALTDHLNLGQELMDDQAERDRTAKLNLEAGSKAQASTAYGAALKYYKNGLVLLGEHPWQRAYELTLALTTQAAEAAMLTHDYEEMERLTEDALKGAVNILDKAKTYEIMIQAFSTRNIPLLAVQTALFGLKQLGVNLPEKPGKVRIIAGLLRTKLRLAGKSPEDILSLPTMEDPRALAASRILERAGSAAYFSVPELLPLVIFQQIKLSLVYGNTQETPFFYDAYGMILAGVLGDVEEGYKYGKLAMQLMEHLNIIDSRAKVILVFNYLIRHRKEPITGSIPPLLDAHKKAMETGDLEYAALTLISANDCSFCSGSELSLLEKEMAIRARTIRELEQKTSLYLSNIALQSVRQLREATVHPSILAGEAYDETTMLPIHEDTQDKASLAVLFFYKLVLAYLFQEPPEWTVRNAVQHETYEGSAPGTPGLPSISCYSSLARLSLYPSASKSERRHILKKVRRNQKKIKHWAQHAPMNHLHRYYLVAAEEARVLGRPQQARELFDKAIESARENDYINDEALAWEVAGRFYLEQGPAHLAHYYLSNAHYAYGRWGAKAKVAHLEKQYPDIFGAKTNPLQHITASTTGRTASTSLDLAAVARASQVIAGEIRTDELIQKLMTLILESMGAEMGVLILEKHKHFYIEARAGESVERLNSLPLDAELNGAPLLPRSLIAYALRTREPLVLEEAGRHELFQDDPYIREHDCRSLLCAPIRHQQKLTGLLYLENNVLPGVFTGERLEILRLLSGQIAVSLKNALDYEELQNANKTKGLFLSKMSHELRTPLSGILGQGRLLQESEASRTGVIERINEIVANGEKLNAFITNILELTQMEGRGPAAMINVVPAVFFETILASFRTRAEAQGLSLTNESGRLPRELRADQEGLGRLLGNLLDNACKFTKTGGIVFRAFFQEGTLRCEIEDTGPGLTAARQKRVFSPFQQTKEAGEGTKVTGLGLAVSKLLVENMGGTISLQSEPGRGSVFMVEIPVEATVPVTVQLKQNDAPNSLPEKIPGPPIEEAQELYQLAKNGDVMGIIEYAEQLERQAPQLTLFAREISRMAKGFQERKLREFIGEYIN